MSGDKRGREAIDKVTRDIMNAPKKVRDAIGKTPSQIREAVRENARVAERKQK